MQYSPYTQPNALIMQRKIFRNLSTGISYTSAKTTNFENVLSLG